MRPRRNCPLIVEEVEPRATMSGGLSPHLAMAHHQVDPRTIAKPAVVFTNYSFDLVNCTFYTINYSVETVVSGKISSDSTARTIAANDSTPVHWTARTSGMVLVKYEVIPGDASSDTTDQISTNAPNTYDFLVLPPNPYGNYSQQTIGLYQCIAANKCDF